MIGARRRSVDLLSAVVSVQRKFIAEADPQPAFEHALELLVGLAESKWGFLGEVRTAPHGKPLLKSCIAYGLDSSDEIQAFQENSALAGMEFPDLQSLIGEILASGEPVVVNTPNLGPRSAGVPSDHPPIDTLLGLPLLSAAGELVGVAGLTNRIVGYDEALAEQLKPFCNALGDMLAAVQRERRRREPVAQAIAEEQRFRSYLDHAIDGVFLHDRTGKILDANQQACDSLGYEYHELIGMVPTQFDPVVTPALLQEIGARLDAGKAFTFESRHKRKDGSTFPVEIRVRPYWNGGLSHAIAIVRDISERKQAEEQLRASESRMRTVLEGLDRIAVQAYEPDGTITFWNRGSEIFYGYSAGEVIGRDIVELLHGEGTRAEEHRLMVDAVRTGEPMAVGELELLRRDGSAITVFASRILHPRPERPPEFFCFDVDITERKRAAEALKESEQRARLALDVAHLGTWRHELAEDIVYFDSRAQAFWGFDAPTITGGEARARIHPDDRKRVLDQWQRAIEAGSEENVCSEFRILEPDGKVRWLSVRGRVIFATDGEERIPLRSIGTYLDVTERMVIELERERLHQEILASREQIRQMSRRVIHAHEAERRDLALELHDEIGQVLTTVNLSLESLRSRIDPAYLYRLDEGSRVVNQAIEQVRELSLNLRPASLDLLGLEAALRAYAQWQASRADLIVDLRSNLHGHRLPPTLETVCFRIVQEALTNVIRHARASHCWIRLDLNQSEMAITVTDDGVGFETAELSVRAARGEGCGLLGMRERVQLFEGTIDLDSSPGCGTVIKARVPLRSMHL
jgi:two-component system, NarL family, sensor histidine kinase UhpB